MTTYLAHNQFGLVGIGKFGTGKMISLSPPKYTTDVISYAKVAWGQQQVKARNGVVYDGVYLAKLDELAAMALLIAMEQGQPYTVTLHTNKQPMDVIFDVSAQVSVETAERFVRCIEDIKVTLKAPPPK